MGGEERRREAVNRVSSVSGDTTETSCPEPNPRLSYRPNAPYLGPPERRALVESFTGNRTREARSAMIESHLYLVDLTMRRLPQKLPPDHQKEDVFAAGVWGLIQAVDLWDSSRGTAFIGFAINKIRWALLEYQRENDRLSRPDRQRVRRLEQGEEACREQGVGPSQEEVARRIGCTVEEVSHWARLREFAQRQSLEAILFEEDVEEKFWGELLIDPEIDVAAEVTRRVGYEAVAAACETLPDRMRFVVHGHYFEGRTFPELSQGLGLSCSATRLIHQHALVRLKEALAPVAALFGSEESVQSIRDIDMHLLFDDPKDQAKLFSGNGVLVWRFEMQNSTVNKGTFGRYGSCPRGDFLLGPPVNAHDPRFGYHFTPVRDYNGHHQMSKYGRRGIGIHGGGSSLDDPFAPEQGWARTLGCLRVQNNANARLVNGYIRPTQKQGGKVYFTVMGAPDPRSAGEEAPELPA